MTMSDLHIQSLPSDASPRVKKSPTKTEIPIPFSYIPSDDGTDENLLIFLHGLGDTHIPFTKLGRQLKLPQTAVLSLRAPEQVPFLYEDAFQWYTSFDDLGEMIDRPNPTPAIEVLTKAIIHLVDVCCWPTHRIHFFGFAQGGTVAAEFSTAWWKNCLAAQRSSSSPTNNNRGLFGSIVSISGPLLSYPTLTTKNPTPVFVVHNPPPTETALPTGAIAAYKKAFEIVADQMSKELGMPSSRAGWEPIMKFWSTHLGRRQMEGLYEIMSGTAQVPP